MSAFTASPRVDAGRNYTFAADPRFTIVPEVHQSYGGAHGSSPIFGRTSSDGLAHITGWHVEVEGSRKKFSPTKRLKDAQAKVQDPAWREWALSRVEVQA